MNKCKEPAEIRPMTNGEMARIKSATDLAWVVKVANHYVKTHTDRYAPIWEKEVAYNEWATMVYDPNEWARHKPSNEAPAHTRTGAVTESLRMKLSPR